MKDNYHIPSHQSHSSIPSIHPSIHSISKLVRFTRSLCKSIRVRQGLDYSTFVSRSIRFEKLWKYTPLKTFVLVICKIMQCLPLNPRENQHYLITYNILYTCMPSINVKLCQPVLYTPTCCFDVIKNFHIDISCENYVNIAYM